MAGRRTRRGWRGGSSCPPAATGRNVGHVVSPGSAFNDPVNGVPGRGGSIDGPGPVIGGGMVFINSGYPTAGGTPGNVLLAFSVDGK